MSKQTYYIVQTGPRGYARRSPVSAPADVPDMDKATRFPLSEAVRVFKEECRRVNDETPRRFPRIVKVTVETKTIKDRR